MKNKQIAKDMGLTEKDVVIADQFRQRLVDSLLKQASDKKLCKVRKDLVDKGLGVPVGDTFVKNGVFQYRWENDVSFQILLNGRWVGAVSTDFVFIDN